MVRFEFRKRIATEWDENNLHSSMVRFELYLRILKEKLIEKFTFQYGSI